MNVFWVGVLGGLFVELITLAAAYESGQRLPERYGRVGFYAVRVALAFAGGVLALVYNVNNFPAALQIGASTPALLAALATVRRPPDQVNGGEPKADANTRA